MSNRDKGQRGRVGRFNGCRGRFHRGPPGHTLVQLTINMDSNTSNYLQFREAFLIEAKETLSWNWASALEHDTAGFRKCITSPHVYVAFNPKDRNQKCVVAIVVDDFQAFDNMPDIPLTLRFKAASMHTLL